MMMNVMIFVTMFPFPNKKFHVFLLHGLTKKMPKRNHFLKVKNILKITKEMMSNTTSSVLKIKKKIML